MTKTFSWADCTGFTHPSGKSFEFIAVIEGNIYAVTRDRISVGGYGAQYPRFAVYKFDNYDKPIKIDEWNDYLMRHYEFDGDLMNPADRIRFVRCNDSGEPPRITPCTICKKAS